MTCTGRINRGSNDSFDSATRDLDAFVQRVFGRDANAAQFPVDIYEDAEHLHIDAELPGFAKEQVEVTIDNNVMTITADRSNAKENEALKTGYLLKERRRTRFQRSFALPNTVDANTVDAKLTDGILNVTLSKRQEAKPRKIAIG